MAGLALCALISACTVTSDNPLCAPEDGHADPRLLGDWFGKKEQDLFRFTQKKGAWMHVDIVPPKRGDKIDSYDFYPVTIGKNNYLNVVMDGKDAQGKPKKVYTFVRYRITHDSVLEMAMISQQASADAVNSGKLKGTVVQPKDAMMVGNPPHPDIDVTLSGSSAELARFIRHADVDALFGDKMETLIRVPANH